MLSTSRKINKFNETLFMGVLALLCFSFSMFRVGYTESKVFLFLNWNLFLAIIPWALTSILIVNQKWQLSKFICFIVLCSWMLFFPNAPYILTDLFHLRLRSSMPIWYDLILILAFAWTGLLFGFLSLLDIETILQKHFKKRSVAVLSTLFLFVGSFGIYIGRFLRWNSWDIIHQPTDIAYDIADRFMNPMQHPRTWGMTLCMGILLSMMYLSFKVIGRRYNAK